MLLIRSCSKFLSKDAGILEIRNCDEILTDMSLMTSVASDIHGVSELRGTRFSSICFNSLCCCYTKSFNYSSSCSIILSDLSKLAWGLVSKQSSED